MGASTAGTNATPDGASAEVREVLLGQSPAAKSCRHCSSVAPIGEWPVEVRVEGDWVCYVGRCPDCDGLDNHYIVDPLR